MLSRMAIGLMPNSPRLLICPSVLGAYDPMMINLFSIVVLGLVENMLQPPKQVAELGVAIAHGIDYDETFVFIEGVEA